MLDTSGTTADASTLAWVRAIVGRASTLHERMGGAYVAAPATEDNDDATQRLEAWQQRVASGDADLFEQRLRFDGLSRANAQTLVGPMALAEHAAVPSWARLLLDVAARMRHTPMKSAQSSQYPIAFEELLADFVDEAQARLRAQTGARYDQLGAPAHAQLQRTLLLTLSWIAGQVLTLEFRVFRDAQRSPLDRLTRRVHGKPGNELYRAFIGRHRADGLKALGSEYASLARLLSEMTVMWVDHSAELIHRLADDRDVVQRVMFEGRDLGEVRMVVTGMSDRHERGRTVAILHFASGDKLVYKPRSQKIEAQWNELLHRFRGPIPLQGLRVLQRPGYGWVEFANANPLTDGDDPAEFYRRVGALLALLHLVSATDCHYENVIASGQSPILVDAETVLHHRFAFHDLPDGFGAQAAAVRHLDRSVLRPGLLPRWTDDPSGGAHDLSGLADGAGGQSRREFACIDAAGSDDLTLQTRPIFREQPNNVPAVAGRPTSVLAYQDSFVSGFEITMRHVASHRLHFDALLAEFGTARSRFIFRPTQVYADLLEDGNHPDLMRSGVRRSIHFDVLGAQRRHHDSPPPWWPLLAAEHTSLSRMDVPTFFAAVDSDELVAHDGTAVHGVLQGPALPEIRGYTRALADRDIDEQLTLVRASLCSRDITRAQLDASSRVAGPTTKPTRVQPLQDNAWLAEASSIGDQLQRQAIIGEDGSATWIGFEHLAGTGRFRLQPISASLYAGSVGMGVFFAALAAQTTESRWLQLARASVAHILADAHAQGRNGIVNAAHGGVAGLGSLTYGLSMMTDFTADSRFIDAATAAAQLITDETIAADRIYDTCGGTAGTVLGLLALWRRTDDPQLLDKAAACGQHLLDARTADPATGAQAWLTIEGRALAGMSHGSAGIAMALFRLGEATGQRRFVDAAERALDFERAVFRDDRDNWPDFRDRTETTEPDHDAPCMSSWCHGAPGIGLARAAMERSDDRRIAQEMSVAAATTARLGVGASDNLCCGNFGRVDALLTMARAARRPELTQQARDHASAAMANANALGGFNLLPGVPRGTACPSFFQGSAGIGYVMLRLVAPQTFPSILSWEDPREHA